VTENVLENPAELLTSLVGLAPELAERVEKDFAPLAQARDALRTKLIGDGQILPFPATMSRPPRTMCAIDGANVNEKMYAADLLVAVAATAEARISQESLGNQVAKWADVLRRQPGTDALVETARHCLEISLAAHSQHEVRILDGAYTTPFIALNKGLFAGNENIRSRVAEMILGEWEAVENLRALLFPGKERTVLSIPKSESATFYAQSFARKYDVDLNVADRFLAAQLLAPGEMFAPRGLDELRYSHMQEEHGSSATDKAIAAVSKMHSEVAAAVSEGRARTTYFKPHGTSSNGTVVRFEYFVDEDTKDPRDSRVASEYAAMLGAETPSPHMLEPFCLWAVDRQVKNISSGATALREALVRELSGPKAGAYATLLASGYRT